MYTLQDFEANGIYQGTWIFLPDGRLIGTIYDYHKPRDETLPDFLYIFTETGEWVRYQSSEEDFVQRWRVSGSAEPGRELEMAKMIVNDPDIRLKNRNLDFTLRGMNSDKVVSAIKTVFKEGKSPWAVVQITQQGPIYFISTYRKPPKSYATEIPKGDTYPFDYKSKTIDIPYEPFAEEEMLPNSVDSIMARYDDPIIFIKINVHDLRMISELGHFFDNASFVQQDPNTYYAMVVRKGYLIPILTAGRSIRQLARFITNYEDTVNRLTNEVRMLSFFMRVIDLFIEEKNTEALDLARSPYGLLASRSTDLPELIQEYQTTATNMDRWRETLDNHKNWTEKELYERRSEVTATVETFKMATTPEFHAEVLTGETRSKKRKTVEAMLLLY